MSKNNLLDIKMSQQPQHAQKHTDTFNVKKTAKTFSQTMEILF